MVLTPSDSRNTARLPGLITRLAVFGALSVLLMVVDQRQNHLDRVRSGMNVVVYPMQLIVSTPASIWDWLTATTVSRGELQKQNSRLRTERLLTNARLQRFAALEAQNARLRAMLNATARLGDRVRVAEIMAVDSNLYQHNLVINKGERDGVYDGQAMVDAAGVVGQVTQTGPYSAQAILISDPDHALPVEVNRNGLRTVAVGTGEVDRLDLPFLNNNADIVEGDLLVTSGLGGTFPAGYPVATVSSVDRQPEKSFAEVSAEPAAVLNQVREVMLIWTVTQQPVTATDASVEDEQNNAVEDDNDEPR